MSRLRDAPVSSPPIRFQDGCSKKRCARFTPRSNADIATALSISLNTVATHNRNILAKTGCANRTEAAAYAMRHGLAP